MFNLKTLAIVVGACAASMLVNPVQAQYIIWSDSSASYPVVTPVSDPFITPVITPVTATVTPVDQISLGYGRPYYWDPLRRAWVHGYGVAHEFPMSQIQVERVVDVRPNAAEIVGGRVSSWREIHPLNAPGVQSLLAVTLNNGREVLINLGPNLSAESIGITRGSEFIMSGTEHVIDSVPMLLAQNATIINEIAPTTDQRLTRAAPVAQQPLGYVEPLQDKAREWIATWPAESRRAAEQMIRKYGEPKEITASMLIWYDNGPWARTIVHRTTVPHNFPDAHVDVIEQTVAARVPIDRAGEFAETGAHVMIDPVRGDITCFCESEACNIVTLNALHDFLTGNLSISQIRQTLKSELDALPSGDRETDAPRLKFSVRPRQHLKQRIA